MHPGESAPAHPDIVFLGDSFTWGHGIENEQTFAHRAPLALGVTGANLAMASYGTTQSLLMLRRNLDLAPRLIVHTFTTEHLLYSTWPCASSYYPFCLDVAHVAWGGWKALLDRARQNQAMEFLLTEMAKTARSIGAALWFVYVPSGSQIPDVFVNSAAKLGVPFSTCRLSFRPMRPFLERRR